MGQIWLQTTHISPPIELVKLGLKTTLRKKKKQTHIKFIMKMQQVG